MDLRVEASQLVGWGGELPPIRIRRHGVCPSGHPGLAFLGGSAVTTIPKNWGLLGLGVARTTLASERCRCPMGMVKPQACNVVGGSEPEMDRACVSQQRRTRAGACPSGRPAGSGEDKHRQHGDAATGAATQHWAVHDHISMTRLTNTQPGDFCMRYMSVNCSWCVSCKCGLLQRHSANGRRVNVNDVPVCDVSGSGLLPSAWAMVAHRRFQVQRVAKLRAGDGREAAPF